MESHMICMRSLFWTTKIPIFWLILAYKERKENIGNIPYKENIRDIYKWLGYVGHLPGKMGTQNEFEL